MVMRKFGRAAWQERAESAPHFFVRKLAKWDTNKSRRRGANCGGKLGMAKFIGTVRFLDVELGFFIFNEVADSTRPRLFPTSEQA